jgi:probable HAF family extracellular repeat protein
MLSPEWKLDLARPYTTLDAPNAIFRTLASGISRAGQIVGTDTDNTPSFNHAFLFRQRGV